MTKFMTAGEVRKFLKKAGYTKPLSIRWTHNPFGGEGKWAVKPMGLPAGVSVVYDSGVGGKESRFGSSDKGETAKLFALLKLLLVETNTMVVA